MAISERDRRAWERQVEALKKVQKPPMAEVTGEARHRLVESINKIRRARGIPDLVNDEDEYPELGFYRLAAARRMLGRS